jgi:hypothetical protein
MYYPQYLSADMGIERSVGTNACAILNTPRFSQLMIKSG